MRGSSSDVPDRPALCGTAPALLLLATFGASPAYAQATDLVGMRAFQLSIEASTSDESGRCPIPVGDLERRLADQLRAARLRVVPVADLTAALGPPREGAGTNTLRHEWLRLPTISMRLTSVPLRMTSGDAGCALAAALHVSAPTETGQVTSAASNREITAPLAIMRSDLSLHIVSARAWPTDVHRHAAAVIQSFVQAWTDANAGTGPGRQPAGAR